MIHIPKGDPPIELLEYKSDFTAAYNSLHSSVKDAWRDSLLKEQGHLCGYTMKKLEIGYTREGKSVNPNIIFEHIEAQTKENELEHNNVILVCNGNKSHKNKKDRFADTRKENRVLDIRLYPTHQKIEDVLNYEYDGTISCDDPILNDQISDNGKNISVLNLNYQKLKEWRVSTLKAVIRDLIDNEWSNESIEDSLNRHSSTDKFGHRLEYCGFICYCLKRIQEGSFPKSPEFWIEDYDPSLYIDWEIDQDE